MANKNCKHLNYLLTIDHSPSIIKLQKVEVCGTTGDAIKNKSLVHNLKNL
jgi:hypothetical protein